VIAMDIRNQDQVGLREPCKHGRLGRIDDDDLSARFNLQRGMVHGCYFHRSSRGIERLNRPCHLRVRTHREGNHGGAGNDTKNRFHISLLW
jgi:hypothetical protein